MSSSADDDVELPFISHLAELRDRLLRAIMAVLLVLIALIPFAGDIYTRLATPLIAKLPAGSQMIAIDLAAPFFTPLKLVFLVAVVITAPWILYQVWAFVAPGLYSHEKKMVLPLVISSTILFLIGVAFVYFIVIPGLAGFIQAVAPESITAAPDVEEYFGFVLTLFFVFGIAFEVPIAVIVLVRIGVVTIEQLKKARGYFIVGAFIVAAIVTPPDVISQLSLAIPMCLLYEGGIIAARLFVKHTKAPEGATEA